LAETDSIIAYWKGVLEGGSITLTNSKRIMILEFIHIFIYNVKNDGMLAYGRTLKYRKGTQGIWSARGVLRCKRNCKRNESM